MSPEPKMKREMNREEIDKLVRLGYRCHLYGDRLHLCLGEKCHRAAECPIYKLGLIK